MPSSQRTKALSDVGSVGDFPEGVIRIVSVDGREIGIACWKGQLYAVRNICPHELGPVCKGALHSKLLGGSAGVGSVGVDSSVPILSCAWHGWEFDLRDGRAIFDPTLKLHKYRVRIDDERVLLEIGGKSD